MKTSLFLVVALSSTFAVASPTATVKSATYSGDVLNVTYELSGGPAVITFDILTNVTGDVWASIGGAAVESGVLHGSEVWMKVSGDGDHSIRWCADAWLGNQAGIVGAAKLILDRSQA